MKDDRRAVARFRLLLIYLLLLAPWIAKGAMMTLQPEPNSPLDWVDGTFAARASYDQFSDDFGAGDVIVISWPGCTLDNPSLDRFTKSLRKAPAFQDSGQWVFHSVISGREVFQRLTSPPLSIPVDEAKRRLSSSLLGPDGKTTAVVIGFNKTGLRKRGDLVPLIRAAAVRYGSAKYQDLHLAGPIIDGYEVDLASQATMSRFAPLSSLVVFCVCILCLNSLHVAILVFGVASLCQAISLAILHYAGGTMTALLIVLPPLIQVLAIAGGIHLVNYYIDCQSNANNAPPNDDERDVVSRKAVFQALRIGWLPCILSSGTTAIGLGSLAVSGLIAVREFGVFSAIGVVLTAVLILSLLPGLIYWKTPKYQATPRQMPSKAWDTLMALQSKGATWISLIGITLMIGLGYGVAQLKASVRIETLFGDESRLIRDYTWIEANVGPLVPIEVIVRFDSHTRPNAESRLAMLSKIEECLANETQVVSVTSCQAFMPSSPVPIVGDYAEQYFDGAKQSAQQFGYFVTDSESDRFRISANLSAFGNQDYGLILQDLHARLNDVVAADSSMEIKLSGLMPLVHEIQRQLLHDLFASFITAFALIAVVMTIVQAGLFAGLTAMIPNVFPSLALFGYLGWLGHPIDIGSIMTASVAMGIAVDDTLHFLNFYDRRIDAGDTRHEAVYSAYRHCGRAMIQTTLICGSGLAIFALSNFMPTARFAWMMVLLLAAALVGDLLLLPALLIIRRDKALTKS
ncbi:MMPL family transporter [Stieleria sp. JC731]|uniref:efflux RND transporter permease subunit n=1 Tax=Pirellulaceae TaxID=2691357 RepID=UPI001E614513|nr:MMPL family transporter [Stieleria sp. JC731]MCC9602113.1 MMPL family transporter [Stieleria sp. JC731]